MGQYCTNNICRSCMSDQECPDNNYCVTTEKANYCCSNDDCSLNNICTTSEDCGSINSYCVSGKCRCKKANIYPTNDQCTTVDDCPENSFCARSLNGNFCLANGSHCLSNYSETNTLTSSDILSCPEKFPFCVLDNNNQFTCSSSPVNTVCINNSCPNNLNCVNNICTTSYGRYGDVCQTDGDCDTTLRLRCSNKICS